MTIGLSADSRQHLCDFVRQYLESHEYEVKLYAALSGDEADYIDAAGQVAEAVSRGECDQAVLFCNTGTGVSIVANKVPGIRATYCVDEFTARIARLANNANILILSMRLTGDMLARQILDTWFASDPNEASERRKHLHQKTDDFDRKYRVGNP